MTATSPRTPEHRVATMTLETAEGEPRDGLVHASADGASTFRDSTTVCGIASPMYHHDGGKHLPLAEVTCAACVTAVMATPFVHAASAGRRQIGRGAIKGAGMRYGTVASCTCGERAQNNVAPSAGGNDWAETWIAEHYAAVQAAL